MVFANKEYLLLLLLIIPYIVWYIKKHKTLDASLQVSDTQMYNDMPKSYKNYLIHVPFCLRILAIIMVIIAIARPQSSNSWKESNVEGIDIILAMDISSSMQIPDLQPNRLEAAKKVAAEFIASRPHDNIGLTLFSSKSFNQCPLTIDHITLLRLLANARTGIIEDGTAIGLGIANAVSHLKDSKAKSKVIILLTDGSNNSGDISPLTAAEIARNFGIRIYTIGIGSAGNTTISQQLPSGQVVQFQVPVEVDEKSLLEIATTTGGKYFRATSTHKLSEIYKDIDKLEKTKLDVKQYMQHEERFEIFAVIALLCILAEILLRNTILKKIP